jgi:hypothetical protein
MSKSFSKIDVVQAAAKDTLPDNLTEAQTSCSTVEDFKLIGRLGK